MSASWPGSMRGPRVKTPLLLLLLLLLLLSSLTRTVLCQYDDTGADPEAGTEVEETDDIDPGDGDTETSEPPPVDSDATSAPDPPPIDEGVPDETAIEEEHGSGQGRSLSEAYETTEDPSLTDMPSIPVDDEALSPVIILIPVVLVVVIIGMIVCGFFINRRWNKKTRDQELRKADPYLDGSSTEKVPMPMFEEDVPSVLELEMEELDQWMKKDG